MVGLQDLAESVDVPTEKLARAGDRGAAGQRTGVRVGVRGFGAVVGVDHRARDERVAVLIRIAVEARRLPAEDDEDTLDAPGFVSVEVAADVETPAARRAESDAAVTIEGGRVGLAEGAGRRVAGAARRHERRQRRALRPPDEVLGADPKPWLRIERRKENHGTRRVSRIGAVSGRRSINRRRSIAWWRSVASGRSVSGRRTGQRCRIAWGAGAWAW